MNKQTIEKPVKTKKFSEISGKRKLNREQRDFLSRRISDLVLKIPGTRLEELINELYQELEKAGISFKPKTYLTDEWGCPQGVPVIGIPFYLADPRLCKLESQLTGVEAESDAEVLMYLRHEAGHAFNYAYRLYLKPGWRQLFGRFSRPYKEEYKTVPFSARFVHHIPGWYAQKHPDDDFAETFAVWLTPFSEWRRKYKDTPALAKLLYVDRTAQRYGRKLPVITDEKLDKPVQDLNFTLDKWYDSNKGITGNKVELHPIINQDLQRLFPETQGQPAAEVLQVNGRRLVRDVNYWTGMDRHLLDALFSAVTERVRTLGLKIGPEQSGSRLVSLAIFLTTLVMNYQFNGQFIDG